MKRMILCLLALVLLTGCGETPATIELPGGGYRSLAEVDGTCYLAENSGILYTLDWNTGEKTVYCKAPADIPWVTSPDMGRIYYLDGEALHCIDAAANQDAVICALPDALELITVTDHYLVYYRGLDQTQDGFYMDYGGCSLNLETLESTLLPAENLDPSRPLFAQGDTVFWVLDRTDELGVYQGCELQRCDLASGECMVLASGDDVIPSPCAMANETLFYQSEEYLYAVPADGSGEPRQLSLTGAAETGCLCLSPDARLLVAQDQDLRLYRYDSATDTAVEIAHLESLDYCRYVVTNGTRYALLGGNRGQDKLILGDLE